MKEDIERKDIQIKVRVSAIEKEKIDNYCAEHNLTISDFLRVAINKLIKEEEM